MKILNFKFSIAAPPVRVVAGRECRSSRRPAWCISVAGSRDRLIFRIVIAKIQVQVGHSPGHACREQVWVIATAFGLFFAIHFGALWAPPVGAFLDCFLVQPVLWFFKTYGHTFMFFVILSWSVAQLMRHNARVADEESAYDEDQQHAQHNSRKTSRALAATTAQRQQQQ